MNTFKERMFVARDQDTNEVFKVNEAALHLISNTTDGNQLEWWELVPLNSNTLRFECLCWYHDRGHFALEVSDEQNDLDEALRKVEEAARIFSQ
jgi:hypothetical protein